MTHLFKTRRQRLLKLALAAVFAAAAMIFVFSAQSGDDSARLSGGLTEWLVRLIKPSCETMSPDERLAFLEKCHHVVRKAAHFCEFALLAFTLSVYFHIKRGSWNMRDALAALALSVVYACTDEVHQMIAQSNKAIASLACSFCMPNNPFVPILWSLRLNTRDSLEQCLTLMSSQFDGTSLCLCSV